MCVSIDRNSGRQEAQRQKRASCYKVAIKGCNWHLPSPAGRWGRASLARRLQDFKQYSIHKPILLCCFLIRSIFLKFLEALIMERISPHLATEWSDPIWSRSLTGWSLSPYVSSLPKRLQVIFQSPALALTLREASMTAPEATELLWAVLFFLYVSYTICNPAEIFMWVLRPCRHL